MRVRQWAVVGTTTIGLVGGTAGLAWATVPTGPQAQVVVHRDCATEYENLVVDLDVSGLEPERTYSLYLQSEQFPPGFDNLDDFRTDASGHGTLEWPVVTGGVTAQTVVVDWEVVDLLTPEMTTVAEGESSAAACTSTTTSASATTTAAASTTAATTAPAQSTTAVSTTAAATTAAATTAAAKTSPTSLPTTTAAGAPPTTTPSSPGTTPARVTPVLANTGAPVMGVALLGGVLVAGGGAALLAARRRVG